MLTGIVTNCFQRQLDGGASLFELIEEAERRGYRAIELRHGSLGEFADASGLPDAAKLTVLPERFPDVRFNVAVPCPFLGDGVDPRGAMFSAGKWAADAVAGERPPHLRLVDLTTRDAVLEQGDAASIAGRLEHLVAAMAEIDGVLSVENGPQRWELFREVFEAARDESGPDAHRLMLCYDPCNLLMNADRRDPAAVTASLSAADVSMLHVKQRKDGVVLPELRAGDLNWAAQVAALREIGYAGPALFEIAPSTAIWEALDASGREFEAVG
jgi:sugar phosphate isomerase/epimerase